MHGTPIVNESFALTGENGAESIVARDGWEWTQSASTESFALDYGDPTAWDAIWKVLAGNFVKNQALEDELVAV